MKKLGKFFQKANPLYPKNPTKAQLPEIDRPESPFQFQFKSPATVVTCQLTLCLVSGCCEAQCDLNGCQSLNCKSVNEHFFILKNPSLLQCLALRPSVLVTPLNSAAKIMCFMGKQSTNYYLLTLALRSETLGAFLRQANPSGSARSDT